MKYLFTIHSHVTFLSALAVIKYEKLDKDEVIIISSNYRVPLEDYTVCPSYDETETSLFIKLKNLNYPAAFDRYIDQITGGEKYIAFIDLMSSGNRILVTNPQCEGFHFIEEGIVNYGNYDSFRLLTIDIDRFPWRINYKKDWKLLLNGIFRIIRGRSLKLLSLPIHPNIYANFQSVKFYCFSEKAFLKISPESKVITPFTIIREEMQSLINGLDISGSCLWLGDSMNRVYGIDLEEFKSALTTFLENWIKQDNNILQRKMYIKFRPDQPDEEKRETLRIFESFGFEITILSYDTIIEALLIASENVNVMGNGTSLLIYANILGHRSYSMFRNIPDKYNIPLAKDYSGVWEMVEAI